MLTIRKKQVESFENISLISFIDEMVLHLQQFAPKHYEVIKEKGVREVIHLGLERAKQYGFTNRGPVRFYIELMFIFGSYFDTDFLLPWAESSLNSDKYSDQLDQADFMYDNMIQYIEKVSGQDDEHSLAAMLKINDSNFDDYQISWENFDEQAKVVMQDIHPQKCKFLGEKLLEKLLLRSKQVANFHKITTVNGTMLMMALIFAIGHGFAEDPLYPWISSTLNNESIIDRNKRAERLENKVRTYLTATLINIKQ